MTHEVRAAVQEFVTTANDFLEIYRRFGIPMETVYKVTEIEDGKTISRKTHKVTPQYLLDNYNYNGIMSAELAHNTSVWLSLKTNYTDKNYIEESFSFKAREDFLMETLKKGYSWGNYESARTMGYGMKLGNEWIYRLFEGYPNTALIDKDLSFAILRNHLTRVFKHNQQKPITIKMQDTRTGSLQELYFENLEKLFDFLLLDGVVTWVGLSGQLVFRFMSTIKGEARAHHMQPDGYYQPLRGTHLTNINIFR